MDPYGASNAGDALTDAQDDDCGHEEARSEERHECVRVADEVHPQQPRPFGRHLRNVVLPHLQFIQ